MTAEANFHRLRHVVTAIFSVVQSLGRAGLFGILLIFAAGVSVGAILAAGWTSRHFRQRSLLLIDPRQQDISLTDALEHISVSIGAGSDAMRTAAAQLEEAVRSGKLGAWWPAGSNMLKRVPRYRAGALNSRATSAATKVGAPPPIWLVRSEVEFLWPRAGLIEVYQPQDRHA